MSYNHDTAVDANAPAEMIYGKYEIDRTYPSQLPPPPAGSGLVIHLINKSDGSTGYKYVAAGTPRPERAGNRSSSATRAVFVRAYENKLPQGKKSLRIRFDTPCDQGDEVVIFNVNSVPTLINTLHLGPKPRVVDKGKSVYAPGDLMLVAANIAAIQQARRVNKHASAALGIEYNNPKGIFVDGVSDEDIASVLAIKDLIGTTLAYASPGGEGYALRSTALMNSNIEFGSEKANSKLAVLRGWLEADAAAIGCDPEIVRGQIQDRINMLQEIGAEVPVELTALLDV